MPLSIDLRETDDGLISASPREVFYHHVASRRGGLVLELVCGTGGVSACLARHGHAVTALTASMIRYRDVQRSSIPIGPGVQWRAGDLTGFDLGRRYDLVVVAANGLATFGTEQELVGCLRSIARHLEPWGALAFDIVGSKPRAGRSRNRSPHSGDASGAQRQISPTELPCMLAAAGLELRSRYGDFDRSRFAETSKAQVCIAEHVGPNGGVRLQ